MPPRLRGAAAAGLVAVLLLVLVVGSGARLRQDFDLKDAFPFEGQVGERLSDGRWTPSSARIETGVFAVRETRVAAAMSRELRGPVSTVLSLDTAGAQSESRTVGSNAETLTATGRGDLAVTVQVQPARRVGVRLHSLTVTPAGPLTLLPSAASAFKAAVATALLASLFSVLTLRPATASIAAVTLFATPVCLLGRDNPAVTLHLIEALWLAAPLLVGGVLAVRSLVGEAAAFLAAGVSLFRLLLLFHPAWYFADIEIHANVARALRDEGRLQGWIHMDELQERFDLGRASVTGTMRPLPYPPLFHTLASSAPDRLIVPFMKFLGAAITAMTLLLTVALARRLIEDESASLIAAVLLALLPFEIQEFLRVSLPALLGRAVDLGVLLLLIGLRNSERVPRLRVALALATACLTYNAAPVHFALFLPLAFAALLVKPARPGDAADLFAATGLSALLALLYYGRYVADVLQNVLAASHAPTVPVPDPARFVMSLIELHGPVVVAALAAAPLVIAGSWRERSSRVALAWTLYVPAIAWTTQIFKEPFAYFRPYFFVYPLFCILAAWWFRRPRFTARLVLAAILVWELAFAANAVPGVFVTHSGRWGDWTSLTR